MNKFKKIFYKFFGQPILQFKGYDNSFVADESAYFKKVKIKIWGNNNKVIFAKNSYIHNTNITIGFSDCPVNNCVVKIGNNSGMNSMDMQLGENDSSVIIGEDCMISYGVEINCTDHHSILDENNNLLNYGESVEIGNHVWICKNVTIMKNSKIPDDCLVGQGSMVAKKFDKTNCVIVGNPAKVVKENIHWTKVRPNDWRSNES